MPFVIPFIPLRDRLPTRTFPFVNYGLIAANIGVFVLEQMDLAAGDDPENLLQVWALVPRRLFLDPIVGVETTFTSMFMHDPTGFAHIAGNMLYLWIFGDNVEDAMGHLKYLAFYLAGGICAAAAQIISGPGSTLPMVGASGAIAAVLAAYAFLYPRSPITMLNPVFILWLFWGVFLQFPAWLVIGQWFVVQLLSTLTSHAAGGVAFMAHVGGFIGGALLLRVFMAGRPRMDDYARWERWARERQRRQRDAW